MHIGIIDHKRPGSNWWRCDIGDLIEVQFNNLYRDPETDEYIKPEVPIPPNSKVQGYFKGLIYDESNRVYLLLSAKRNQPAIQYPGFRIADYNIQKKSLFSAKPSQN